MIIIFDAANSNLSVTIQPNRIVLKLHKYTKFNQMNWWKLVQYQVCEYKSLSANN